MHDIIYAILLETNHDENKMKEQIDTKNLMIRVPKDMWSFLRMNSFAQEESMNAIVLRCLEKYRKKIESKLTTD